MPLVRVVVGHRVHVRAKRDALSSSGARVSWGVLPRHLAWVSHLDDTRCCAFSDAHDACTAASGGGRRDTRTTTTRVPRRMPGRSLTGAVQESLFNSTSNATLLPPTVCISRQ